MAGNESNYTESMKGYFSNTMYMYIITMRNELTAHTYHFSLTGKTLWKEE